MNNDYMTIQPTEEFIIKNYKKTLEFVDKFLPEERKNNVLTLLKENELRYMFCPASYKKEYFSYFPGGLCFHNLRVLKLINKFNECLNGNISKDSLLIVSLFHEIGKLGTKEKEYFIPVTEKWKIDKGIYYDINPNIQFVKINHRSLYWLNQYNIKTTEDEFLSILLSQGHLDEENLSYKYKEPKLSLLLQMAESWSIKEERELKIIFP